MKTIQEIEMYSTDSNTTREACEKMGFNFDVKFVETYKRNGKIYVRGTAGKKEEFAALKNAAKKAGYIYTGKI